MPVHKHLCNDIFSRGGRRRGRDQEGAARRRSANGQKWPARKALGGRALGERRTGQRRLYREGEEEAARSITVFSSCRANKLRKKAHHTWFREFSGMVRVHQGGKTA